MFFFSGAILLIAPLIRGGNRQVSLIVLLGLSLLLLATLFAAYTYSKLAGTDHPVNALEPVWRKLLFGILLFSPVWVGILHLFPIPIDAWRLMQGRSFYLEALQAMDLTLPSNFPLSLSSNNTWASVLAGVPIVAIFVSAQFLPIKAIKSLLAILLAAACLQVLLSVLQLAFGKDSVLYFDAVSGGIVIGSFANRNHLANFLSMSLPICIFILFEQSIKKQNKNVASLLKPGKPIALAILLFLGFAILGILLATLSRGGVFSGFIVLGLSIFIYLFALGRKVSRKQRFAFFSLALFFMVSALFSASFESLQSRLGEQLMTDTDVRQTIAHSTLEASRQFWPWGSGLGSFEAVFPRFKPTINIPYVEYAHNDYVQLLMELGVAGLVLMVALAVLIVSQLMHFIRIYSTEQRLSRNTVLQCFCGVSLLGFLLHCWVDFNMHIPALAITASFLAGVFLRKSFKTTDVAPDLIESN